MIPSASNSDYPIFVADQVLTSDNLNDLFGYLDEQGRMTRTNLVGMGIVCGLQPVTTADGSSIKITKGVGVTSFGYLVAVPEITYTRRGTAVFDAVKCAYYDRFVDISLKQQRFDMWELKQAAETTDTTPLNAAFLDKKVVLVFVELLEENNKNCDPDSCDDKGTKVTVNFRPLLVSKTDVDTFLSNQSNSVVTGKAVLLPEARMPRYDVPATTLLDSQDVFHAYLQLLNKTFIDSVFSRLSNAYVSLSPLLKEKFPVDPFPGREVFFSFLYDTSISDKQVLTLQYYYDFFADLLMGYDELRKKAAEVVCECLPDESLFPRHLLLGEAIGYQERTSQYRTRFIASPVACGCTEEAEAVVVLFNRLVLMLDNLVVQVLPVTAIDKRTLTPLKITPSLHGAVPLSEKAIPFYYTVNSGVEPLYLHWNHKRTATNTATGILSYKSFDYNTSDEFVKDPLKFDLEPANFLRIEGHIGYDYRKVLSDLDRIKKSNRLPFDVVALSSDTRGIFSIADAITQMDTTGSITAAFEEMVRHPCCFADLFLALDEWINKLRCCLAEQMLYYMQLPSFTTGAAIAGERKFFSKTIPADKKFEIKENTIGQLYKEKLDAGTINNQFCSEVFVHIATGNAQAGSALVMMPYKIDRLTEILPEHITQLDAKELEARYADLTATATQMRNLYASPNVAGTLTGVDATHLSTRLEMNCLVCLFLEFRLLVREFLIRLLGLMLKQKLGYYSYKNPGIQHKAGVPVGGTFIIVYHEQSERRKPGLKPDFTTGFKRVKTHSGTTTNSFVSGEQPLLSSMLLLEELLFLQQVNQQPDVPDKVLDPIVDAIQPGTVIADFFVPYLCCSDCPPTQMVVLPEPEIPNQPPVARPGSVTPIELPVNSVTLDGSTSSDPDGSIQTYAWQQESGPSNAIIGDPAKATTTASGLEEGIYVFKLTVTDNDGASASDTVTVIVTSKPNVPPVAVATTDKPIVVLPDNAARLFSTNSTDPDGEIRSFLWTLPANTTGAIIQSANAPSSNVFFTKTGVYVFTLTVTDDRGATGTATVTIVVSEAQNQPPVAKASANPDSMTLIPGTVVTVQLDGSGSVDPEGAALTFVWSLPPGTTGASIDQPDAPVTTATFTQPGAYTFTLTVKDDKGATGTATAGVTVKQATIEKTCASLLGIIELFNGLRNVDTVDNFKAFTAAYKPFKDIQAFYRIMEAEDIASKPVADQVAFFIQQEIAKRLPDWIRALLKIIKEKENLRLLALTMLQVHAQLAYYIACIQAEDIDDAKVPMAEAITALLELLKQIEPDVANYDSNQRIVLGRILSITRKEKDRVVANGERTTKPLYFDLLEKIESVLLSMPL